ncbi:fungal hydrophobin-domain-containing protein [Cubamyces menziesii]|uniref:Hydrophobin n=1 Tax=Trametes cubensis TaxID=1111947 RepID=A0AAD7XD03_9APHY|nr:fungal hydrophobin-domain-containing protein [Cubamyces menziesii]KAJ8487057.1 hypothetical protein ONZ51_g4459 [Trametes cubensis]
MVARITSAFIALVAATAAAASAIPRTDGSSQCNTGSIQCCDTTTQPSDPAAQLAAGLLGIDLGSITGLVGLNCSPVTVVGVGATPSCKQQPVCCQNNSVGGLLSVGCIPVSL